MKIMVVGASGKAGKATRELLSRRGHTIVTVGRNSGDIRCDISQPEQLSQLWSRVGRVDAVVSAAGDVPYAPLEKLGPDDYRSAFDQKVHGQIDLVRTGLPYVAERGSFTLITGVTARDPILQGAAAAMANGAVESFVRAAAVEIAPQRINAVSPSVFTESLPDYGDYFPGFAPVDLAEVARAYQKSVEGARTGEVIIPA
ncbi:short chain dehydrogenase [Nocardiopsis sp. HNM0947]|uniref:Short chain dehydrogenase n=1 Tax=Nocardiopsis coralli TaxID=2772213 RepID=A0ABR9P181_9ACTN|nr:short chain dehydrogenase [Nocardiopsis coralli]MBE2997589.1 short chain dehydrogenase [Nocardiopsis coralli]